MAYNNIKAKGINQKTIIKVNSFFKNSQYCVVNWSENYKDQQGKWQVAQKYAIWIDNQEAWERIVKGASFKIKYITGITFRPEYEKNPTDQVISATQKPTIVINLNAVVEMVEQPQAKNQPVNQDPFAQQEPNFNDMNYQYQDYKEQSEDFASIMEDDLDLPF